MTTDPAFIEHHPPTHFEPIDANANDLERPPDIRLPEIILGITPDARHIAIQTTIFIDRSQTRALANALTDIVNNLDAGYQPPEAKP